MDSSELVTLSSSSPSIPMSRWWSENTVAIVTGANKGIGYCLVRKLARMGLRVVLTARDEGRGLRAVESLASDEGLRNVHFFRLDVADTDSIQEFASSFKESFGVWDILVNNAAVSFNDIHENSVEHADIVMKTNFYGPKLLTEALLPMSRRSSSSIPRILNLSSRLGLLNKLKNGALREMLMDEDKLSEKQIEYMVAMFLENAKSGEYKIQGWPQVWPDYSVSKLALNAYSRLLAKRYHQGNNNGGLTMMISVNCFCPGFTQTSMTGGKGKHTPDDAALFAAHLALLPPEHLPSGKFFIMSSNPHIRSTL